MNVSYANRANMIALCSVQHLMLCRNYCPLPSQRTRELQRQLYQWHYSSSIINYSARKLSEKKVKYHKSCYSSFANADKISRVQKRFQDSIEAAEGSVFKIKAGGSSDQIKDHQQFQNRTKIKKNNNSISNNIL